MVVLYFSKMFFHASHFLWHRLPYADWMFRVMWILLTNQSAWYQDGIATLFLNLFVTLPPDLNILHKNCFLVLKSSPLSSSFSFSVFFAAFRKVSCLVFLSLFRNNSSVSWDGASGLLEGGAMDGNRTTRQVTFPFPAVRKQLNLLSLFGKVSQLTSSLTSLDLTKQVNLSLVKMNAKQGTESKLD